MFSVPGPPVTKTATDYGYLTFKRKTVKDLKTGSKNIFVINFENKGFDKIHVSSLFCCQDVIFQLPEHRKQIEIFLFIL